MRYQESVEEGGQRWSKPHVPSRSVWGHILIPDPVRQMKPPFSPNSCRQDAVLQFPQAAVLQFLTFSQAAVLQFFTSCRVTVSHKLPFYSFSQAAVLQFNTSCRVTVSHKLPCYSFSQAAVLQYNIKTDMSSLFYLI